MSQIKRQSFFKNFSNALSQDIKIIAGVIESGILKSIPLIGSQLEQNRKLLYSLSELFENKDDEIQKDIKKVLNNLSETEEVVSKLRLHIETQQNRLNETLKEYEHYKDLAAIEKEKSQPLLKELRHENRKGIILGLIINITMIILGFILSHYIKLWFPTFTF